MRLTKKKALEITTELWAWLAETGKRKAAWSGWEKYGYMDSACPLCEYTCRLRRNLYEGKDCRICPLGLGYYGCYETSYSNWEEARTDKTRRKYANLFLEQLKQL